MQFESYCNLKYLKFMIFIVIEIGSCSEILLIGDVVPK